MDNTQVKNRLAAIRAKAKDIQVLIFDYEATEDTSREAADALAFLLTDRAEYLLNDVRKLRELAQDETNEAWEASNEAQVEREFEDNSGATPDVDR